MARNRNSAPAGGTKALFVKQGNSFSLIVCFIKLIKCSISADRLLVKKFIIKIIILSKDCFLFLVKSLSDTLYSKIIASENTLSLIRLKIFSGVFFHSNKRLIHKQIYKKQLMRTTINS